MMKSIRTNKAIHAALRKRFGVTSQMIWYSLHYVKNGPASVKIRRAAIEMGGVYAEENFIPTCRIEEIPEGFRQVFADGVVLTVNIKKSCAEISHRGDQVLKCDKISLDGWGSLAMQAQKLAVDGMLEIPV